MSKEVLIKTIVELSAPCAEMKRSQVGAVLDALPATIHHLLQNGTEMVALPGIGRFSKVFKDARKARNPRTGEMIDVPAHYKVKFMPAAELKRAVRP